MSFLTVLSIILYIAVLTTVTSKPSRVSDSTLQYLFTFQEGQSNPYAVSTTDKATGIIGNLIILNSAYCTQWLSNGQGVQLMGICRMFT